MNTITNLFLSVIAFFSGLFGMHQDMQSPTPSTSIVQPRSGSVYTDDSYDFSLTFPSSWNGYQASHDWGAKDSKGTAFSLNGSIMFLITIHSKQEWENIKKSGDPLPRYLGENTQYVYTYVSAQDYPGELVEQAKMKNSILSSFIINK
jgi:hypothetical protein